MKVKRLKCPECGANLDIEEGRSFCFCQYCGCKIMLDDEKQEYTINKNININKNVHKRYTNDAEVIKANNIEKENKRSWIALIVYFAILIGIPVVLSLVMIINENAARNEGKISAGFYRDLLDEDYKTVEAHFKAAGFSNIELIDLNDSGIAFWNDGKVETISIGGDISFDSTDFYDPDTKVVISYH